MLKGKNLNGDKILNFNFDSEKFILIIIFKLKVFMTDNSDEFYGSNAAIAP